MNIVGTLVKGVVIFLGSLLAIPLGPLAVLFARWDKEPSVDSKGGGLTIRGDLPVWLRWFQTPDERLPGGTYEPKVAEMLEHRGRMLTSMYWVGWRNRAHGLAAALGRPATKEQYDVKPGDQQGLLDLGGGLWRFTKKLGPFRFVAGYRVYALSDGSYVATPTLTLKLS